MSFFACRSAPNTELLKSLEGKVPEIYPIGDCREPSLIIEAIADGSRIARAIETIRGGKVYLSPILLKELTEDMIEICRGNGKPAGERLTNREREVLKLIAEGKSNKEIANLLFISIHTVQNHRASIMKKLNLKKIADVIRYAIRKGYVSEDMKKIRFSTCLSISI